MQGALAKERRYKTQDKTRDISVDSLRGLAILLMVAGHVIGAEPDRAMGVSHDSLWHYYYVGLADIRMPLFTILSGYVYAIRPIGRIRAFPKLMRGKARRLLIPLLTVGTIFFFTQLLVPGTNRKPELVDLWKVYIYGIEHLWFLQAIFLIFLVVGLLDAFDVMKSQLRWTLALSAASLIYVFAIVPSAYNVFSLSGFVRLLPFFLLGYGFNKFGSALKNRWILVSCLIGFVVTYSVRLVTIIEGYSSSDPPMRALSLSVGIFGVGLLMLMRHRITSRMLAWLGGYSFSVYLLHVFGFAGVRILVLENVGIENHLAVFLVCMIAAVGLPILFERTFGRITWISWGLLGQRPRPSFPSSAH